MAEQTATIEGAPAFAFFETPAVQQAAGLVAESIRSLYEQSAYVAEMYERLSASPSSDRALAYLAALETQTALERASADEKGGLVSALRQSFAELGLTESQR